jgi:hypothetical protein
MSIIAKSSGNAQRELIPAGNYVARCYQMLDIGTVDENIMGDVKHLHKVRIGFELPTELKVFKEENGEQPIVISKEFTLSLHEKSALRQSLKAWRSKDFTEEEARAFDISKLLGIACMLNIIHKPAKKDPTKIYEEIAGITPIPKGMTCPEQINPTQELSFDEFNQSLFEKLPDFLRDKIKSSDEYKAMVNPGHFEVNQNSPDEDDLPF